jgi:hypothetical protein
MIVGEFAAILEEAELFTHNRTTETGKARLAHLHRVLRKLERPHSPFINPPTRRDALGVHSVTPKLVTEIQFAEWTQEGLLRHASFLGLRDDKPARTIVRKVPNPYPTGNDEPECRDRHARRQTTIQPFSNGWCQQIAKQILHLNSRDRRSDHPSPSRDGFDCVCRMASRSRSFLQHRRISGK